jgi:hypothetical protein
MIDLIYIASPSFSGSTLLTFLLNAHPAIATIGELKWGEIDLQSYRCSCGALLVDCSFWKQVEARMHARGLPFDLKRPATDFRCRERPFFDRVLRARIRGRTFERARDISISVLSAARRALPLARTVNRALIEIILELQRGKAFLDGSKDPVRLRHLFKTGDYNIRVIQIIRDGRAVTYSAVKNKTRTVRSAALEWMRTHIEIGRLSQRLGPDRLFSVRYEDLCADPGSTIGRICDFLNLPSDVAVPDYRCAEHHILGNRMRLEPSADIRLDTKWRSALSAEDLRNFGRLSGKLNKQYGYA